MKPIPGLVLIAVLFAGLLGACKKDCREDVRLGDFELSQGNHARAEKLFKQAWAADSLSCADVRDRLENLRLFRPPSP